MQVISSSHAARPPLGAIVVSTVIGAFLVLGGLFLAWVAFATPVITGLTATPNPRPGLDHLAFGGAIWAITLVAPPSFAIVGALRLGRVARALAAKPAERAVTRAARMIGDDCTAASNVRLPDGRIVRDLVFGPFGFAIINELPPPHATRHSGASWEIRRADGRWTHFENPLERTTRDGERIRRWVGSTERDFLVKVYSAVVTTDPAVERTPTCAVVTPDQIPAWLASLPAARALTPDRRAEILEELQALI